MGLYLKRGSAITGVIRIDNGTEQSFQEHYKFKSIIVIFIIVRIYNLFKKYVSLCSYKITYPCQVRLVSY